MVLDSSAVVAILLDEPERPTFVRLISEAPECLMSAGTLVECSVVMEARLGTGGGADVDDLLRRSRTRIVPVDVGQAEAARAAWRRYGRGRHAAKLNLGDLFSYALAKTTGLPLLCKGCDFSQTDVVLAAA